MNLLAHHFDGFRDESRFDDKKVRILKRAQIFVADLWAAFGGESYGHFDDIDAVTMFAGNSCLLFQVQSCIDEQKTIGYHKCFTLSAVSHTAHRLTTLSEIIRRSHLDIRGKSSFVATASGVSSSSVGTFSRTIPRLR